MVVGGLVNTCALSAFPVGGLRIEFPGRLSTSIVVGVCKQCEKFQYKLQFIKIFKNLVTFLLVLDYFVFYI